MNRVREARFPRFHEGRFVETTETLVKESKLEIWFEDIMIAMFTCTPEYKEQLAMGYLLTSGLVDRMSEVEIISSETTRIDFSSKSKSDFVKRFLMNQASEFPSLTPLEKKKNVQVSLSTLKDSVSYLLTEQKLHSLTGGAHGAIVQDLETFNSIIVEDIGRSNAVDKVVGLAVEADFDITNSLLLVTGRLTSEMVSKAVRAKIPIMGSLAIATDMGIHIAMNANLTLLGKLKDPSFWLYNQGHAQVVI